MNPIKRPTSDRFCIDSMILIAFVIQLTLICAQPATAEESLDKLFRKREQNEAGAWRLLEEPSPGTRITPAGAATLREKKPTLHVTYVP